MATPKAEMAIEPTWGEFIRSEQDSVRALLEDYRNGKITDRQYMNELNGRKLLDKQTNTFLSGVRQIRGNATQKAVRGFLTKGKGSKT